MLECHHDVWRSQNGFETESQTFLLSRTLDSDVSDSESLQHAAFCSIDIAAVTTGYASQTEKPQAVKLESCVYLDTLGACDDMLWDCQAFCSEPASEHEPYAMKLSNMSTSLLVLC